MIIQSISKYLFMHCVDVSVLTVRLVSDANVSFGCLNMCII